MVLIRSFLIIVLFVYSSGGRVRKRVMWGVRVWGCGMFGSVLEGLSGFGGFVYIFLRFGEGFDYILNELVYV